MEATTITVDRDQLLSAVETYFSTSSRESWMSPNGIWCLEFFSDEEKPCRNDMSSEGFKEYLINNGFDVEDRDINDEHFDAHYSEFVASVKEWWASLLLDEVTTENGAFKIEYV